MRPSTLTYYREQCRKTFHCRNYCVELFFHSIILCDIGVLSQHSFPEEDFGDEHPSSLYASIQCCIASDENGKLTPRMGSKYAKSASQHSRMMVMICSAAVRDFA